MENTQPFLLIWRGREVEVDYDPQSFAGYGHLQIRSRYCRPLPITETGYRSHFVDPADVAFIGGPGDFVAAWLDHAAQSKAWRRTEKQGVQIALF